MTDVVYIPRFTAPDNDDLNWRHTSYGGNNSCLRIKGASVLPNCVGYAWGRWSELLHKRPRLSRGNAEDWWNNSKYDEYERGSKPRLGAVACWSKGLSGYSKDGYGHVSIVEDVLPDGTIVTSNSAYNGSRFYMRSIKPPYHLGTYYKFQGFIYPPTEFVKKKTPKLKSINEVAKEVIQGKWGNGRDRINKLTTAGYSYKDVQTEVEYLLKRKRLKPIPTIAEEVIRGEWGNATARKHKLERAGYSYDEVQGVVNQMLSITRERKGYEAVAKDVVKGKWGNGYSRRKALEAAGYSYVKVQKLVDELLRR